MSKGDRTKAGEEDIRLDQAPAEVAFLAEVHAGLESSPRSLPCKYFYDEKGARFFERICELEEYYPTRTELGIMEQSAGEMAALLGPRVLLVEYGSGEGLKTRVLLEALIDPAAYVPVDISCAQLGHITTLLRARFPGLEVLPVCADYTTSLRLPRLTEPPRRRAVYFPGSTIGNFTPDEAVDFLDRIRRLIGAGGALLIGVDLRKDSEILERAYNDATGVTAAFNLNLLERINRELGADFDLTQWRHRACFNSDASRIEMHLDSLSEQTVTLGGKEYVFAAGESIHTENSHKYSLDHFARLAGEAGLAVDKVWTDPRDLFSVQHLVVAEQPSASGP